MVSISPMRATFIAILVVLVITGIVALSIDKTVTRVDKSNKEIVYLAFNIVGVIFACVSLVFMILLTVACRSHYKIMMSCVIFDTTISMVCFAISVGVHSSIVSVMPISWMMAALWISVIGVTIAFVFLFSDPSAI